MLLYLKVRLKKILNKGKVTSGQIRFIKECSRLIDLDKELAKDKLLGASLKDNLIASLQQLKVSQSTGGEPISSYLLRE